MLDDPAWTATITDISTVYIAALLPPAISDMESGSRTGSARVSNLIGRIAATKDDATREVWAQIARDYNLPDDIVALIAP
jgi:hypothetical protein